MEISQVIQELRDLIFFDPDKNDWVLAEEYLSGNIREKIKSAKIHGLENNIIALTKRLPLCVVPSASPEIKAKCAMAMGYEEVSQEMLRNTINAKLGCNWIPPEYIESFIKRLISQNGIRVVFQESVNSWTINGAYRSDTNTVVWGSGDMTAVELITCLLCSKEIKVYSGYGDDRKPDLAKTEKAKAKADEIQTEFQKWLWQDEERAIALTILYNERFNSLQSRSYDGSHLELIGSSKEIELRPHQKNGIWRIVQSNATLLPYAVGYGKTFTMIGAIMELRRMKLAHKPMLVVLNSTLAQIHKEFKRLYPTAKLLVATTESFAKAGRKQFISRIATGDWDCVLIAHSQFFNIKVSAQNERAFLNQECERLNNEIQVSRKINGDTKILERRKASLIAQIKETTQSERKDEVIDWELLGIDALFIDESQFFKNLHFDSRLRNITGLPNSDTQRSTDTLMKVHQVLANGGRVVFSTGTPICNSIAELYTLQRYLDNDYLKKIGLQHFDAWIAQFANAVSAPEITASGNYKVKTRFSEFVNLPELMALYNRFADFPEVEIKLDRPELEIVEVSAPSTPEQDDFLRSLSARSERIAAKEVEPDEDNMLVITSDGRKSSIDPRLVIPSAQNHPYMKLNKLAWNVWQIWKTTKATKATQLIFCDFSTPHPDRHNAYYYVRDLLISLGIPRSEIAIIHSCKNDNDRSALFAKTQEGLVRVLMGSTQKLGTGVNVQSKLIAEHHLDAPWRPSDVEQRTGRTQRQGNMWPTVWSFRYVTEGNNQQSGFDAFLWQALENKARFIAQVSTGKCTNRVAEDIDEAVISYSQMKAIATGNPLIIKRATLEAEYSKLRITQRNWEETKAQRYVRKKQNAVQLERLPKLIEQLELDRLILSQNSTVNIDYEGDLTKWLKKMTRTNFHRTKIGSIGNFNIFTNPLIPAEKSNLFIKGNYHYTINPSAEAIEQWIANGIEQEINRLSTELKNRQIDAINLEKEYSKEFDYSHLNELRRELHELNAQIHAQNNEITGDIIYSTCAEYQKPDQQIITELQNLDDYPQWLREIEELQPTSNVINFPLKKTMTELEIVPTYTFVPVANKGKEIILQGTLF